MKFIFLDRAGAKSIWTIIEKIADRLAQDGHQIYFIRFDDGRSPYAQDVPQNVKLHNIQVPVKKWVWDLIPQHLVFTQAFRSLLRQIKPDLIHTNFAVPSIAARWIAAREGVPFVVSTQHEMYGSMSFHYRWGLRATEKLCSAVTYVSETVSHSFGRKIMKLEDADFIHKPIHVVIPNGVDLNAIRSAIAKNPAKVSRKLVCAGRMVPEKGQVLLLKALKTLLIRHPQVQLSLIGSGPMELKLRQTANDLGLEKHVTFTGWLPHDQVLVEMASAELVVVPSLSVQEGFGLVLAEALVCGTSLLVSDTPLFHEVLDHFPGRGEFFSEGNAAALAESLDHYFSSHSPPAQPVPAMDSEKEAMLSSDSMVDAYLKLYHRLFQEKKF